MSGCWWVLVGGCLLSEWLLVGACWWVLVEWLTSSMDENSLQKKNF